MAECRNRVTFARRRALALTVELDREVIAALAGALRPGGAGLGAANEDPVASKWSRSLFILVLLPLDQVAAMQ